MSAMEEKTAFEQSYRVYERALLQFQGVEGFDVYNCSVPFHWKGKTYLAYRLAKVRLLRPCHAGGSFRAMCSPDILLRQDQLWHLPGI